MFIIDDYEVFSPTAAEQLSASNKSSETVPVSTSPDVLPPTAAEQLSASDKSSETVLVSTSPDESPVVSGLCGVRVCLWYSQWT